jgi:hypothetical protein
MGTATPFSKTLTSQLIRANLFCPIDPLAAANPDAAATWSVGFSRRPTAKCGCKGKLESSNRVPIMLVFSGYALLPWLVSLRMSIWRVELGLSQKESKAEKNAHR